MPTFDATDFDNAVSESGTVHESTANTDHTDASQLKQGYDIANPYLSADLVGYWPLQENSGSTAYDFSGNNFDGTINGATVNQTGLLGTSAYSFDGTDDYVDIPSPTQFTQYTVSLWVYMPSFTSITDAISLRDNNSNIFRTRDTTSGNDAITNGIEWAHDETSSSGGTVYCESTMPIDKWVFFAVTWDGSTITLYRNGSAVDSVSASSIVGFGGVSEIGGRSSASRSWNGRICMVRISDIARTASEIQALYDVVATQGDLTTQFKSV